MSEEFDEDINHPAHPLNQRDLYTREDDDIIDSDGKKVASFDKNGTLRMVRGHGDLREDVMAYLGLTSEGDDRDTTEPAPIFDDKPLFNPPAGDPTMGDKDPVVVEWWFKNHPVEAKQRYAGRKFSGSDKFLKS